jgi:hypothetical protein
MGKGKDKKGKGKKDDGGVRIPKPLRKAGKEALKLAKEPVVTEIVAAALLSAAAALRGDKAAAKAGKASADTAADAVRQAGKIGDSLRTLAIDLARRTLDNWDRPGAAAGGSGKGKKGGKGSAAAGSKG